MVGNVGNVLFKTYTFAVICQYQQISSYMYLLWIPHILLIESTSPIYKCLMIYLGTSQRYNSCRHFPQKRPLTNCRSGDIWSLSIAWYSGIPGEGNRRSWWKDWGISTPKSYLTNCEIDKMAILWQMAVSLTKRLVLRLKFCWTSLLWDVTGNKS